MSAAILLALSLSSPPATAAPLPVPWEAAQQELAEVLSGYLRVPTINPPGDETLGAEYLAAILRSEGISSEIVEAAPGRGSLIARLPATHPSGEAPLCLLSHIDVVTAEPERWAHPPFGGEIINGEVWGRGALDMKGMGALETMTVVWLQRLAVPRSRDVILLAVADEEVSNLGARQLASMWDRIGCSQLINEGGMPIKDVLFPGQTLAAITTGEKGVLWLKVTATGSPGHGSTPLPGRAPDRLLAALARVEAIPAKPSVFPGFYDLFAAAGRAEHGLTAWVLRSPLAPLVLPRALMREPTTRAAITNTLEITGLDGMRSPNVVPAEVSASLDIRLLPGVSPEDMLARVRDAIDDPAVHVEVLQAFPAQVSPHEGDNFYAAIARNAEAWLPNTVAGPALSVGYTDSNLLRPLGVHAYGFVPFPITVEEATTMHGDNERVRVSDLGLGLKVLLHAVAETVEPAK